MRDYLGAIFKQPEDATQHGILGMKWGRRRTDAELARDIKARKAAGEKVTPTEKAQHALKDDGPDSHQTTGSETSSQRYYRLQQQAKQGGASSMSEQDLKFFNARTEALTKVNKMYAKNPSWLGETSKKVLQQAAQNTMQSIADGVAKKYVSQPILDSINNVEKKN